VSQFIEIALVLSLFREKPGECPGTHLKVNTLGCTCTAQTHENTFKGHAMVAMALSNQTAPVRGKWHEALQRDNIFIMEVASLPSKVGWSFHGLWR